MENSLPANRRLAKQVVLLQVAAASAAGLAFLLQSGVSALAALAAGLLVAVGTGLMALRLFGQALAGPGATAARLVVGMLLKWIVVIVGLYLILVYWRLPAIPALVGLVAALLVNLVVLGFKR